MLFRSLAPGSSKHPPRPPLNAKMISQLVQHLDLGSPLDAAVAACATTAFWGQCHLGELLPSTSSSLFSTLFLIRSGFKRSLHNPHSCVLHLPHTKTHRHGQDIVLVDQCASINPIFLLKKHLHLSGVPDDAHIFSFASMMSSEPSWPRKASFRAFSALLYTKAFVEAAYCFLYSPSLS